MDLENYMNENISSAIHGTSSDIELDKYDEIRDFKGNLISPNDVKLGSVVTLYNYIAATKTMYLPMGITEDKKSTGIVISVEKMIDVYIWDGPAGKWRFLYTGNPSDVLLDDEELMELKKDANDTHHLTPGIVEEGDIIYLCAHGTQEPYSDDEYEDPTGLYMLASTPHSYIYDDDEDSELHLLSVYAHLRFMQDVRPKMEEMVDFITDIISNMDNSEEK